MNAKCQHCGKDLIDATNDTSTHCADCQASMQAEIDRMVNEGGPDVQHD